MVKRKDNSQRGTRSVFIDAERRRAINAVHWYGSSWESDLTDLDNPAGICDVRTPSSKNKFQKRQGAKAVKKVEMEGNMDDLLEPEQATTFRALTARANYLSQDRVDTSYSTKELCREFAAPANSSLQRLKRLARFLVGKPR